MKYGMKTGKVSCHDLIFLPNFLPFLAGSLATLKHHKDDVQTVKTGMECGLSADRDIKFEPGDVVMCFKEVDVPQVTSWDPGF